MKPFAKLFQLHFCLLWLVTLVVAGCASYPMGLNREQWEALSPAQQADFQARQHAINEERARRYAAEQTRRIQAQREAEEQERARVSDAYSHARFGEIVTITIREGVLAFYGKRHPYEPVAFDLVRGESKPILFRRQGQPHIATQITMRLSEDGNTFYFDDSARKRFVAVNTGWDRGCEYLPPEVGGYDGQPAGVGLHITIKYRPVSTDYCII